MNRAGDEVKTKAQLRAEARARKILANSEDRFRKLGVTTAEPINGFTEYKDDDFPDLQTPRAAYSGITGGDETDDVAFDREFSIRRDEMNDIFSNFSQSFSSTPPAPEPPKVHPLIGESRCHIVLLAIVTYFATILFPQAVGGYLFLPLFICELCEVFMFGYSNRPSIMRTMLVMSGISPGNADILLKALSVFGNYLKDACIYVFTIIITHELCTALLK